MSPTPTADTRPHPRPVAAAVLPADLPALAAAAQCPLAGDPCEDAPALWEALALRAARR